MDSGNIAREGAVLVRGGRGIRAVEVAQSCSVAPSQAHAAQPAIARQLSQHSEADDTAVALPRSGGPIPVLIKTSSQAGATGGDGPGGTHPAPMAWAACPTTRFDRAGAHHLHAHHSTTQQQ